MIFIAATCCRGAAEQPASAAASAQLKPALVAEARARARLLQETIRGSLHIIHRDFFDEDDAHAIPSASLEDVFAELSRRYHVDVKWLNVQTDVLNIEHQPADQFERQAAVAIDKGELQFDKTINDRYRFAGSIRLGSQCLKCHVKNGSRPRIGPPDC